MRLLARDELALADIAIEVGFSCQSHLTNQFRKHLGTTPGAFRGAARVGHRRAPQFITAMTANDPDKRSARLLCQ
jgi:AraC-like DNA-binding protein